MIISYWPEYIALNSQQPYSAALESLHHAGHSLAKESLDADAAIIWSVLWNGRMQGNQAVWQHYRNQDKPVIVVEVGGIKRGVTWKVGVNGINRDADFGIDASNQTRAAEIGLTLTDWRKDGEFILLCGQHDRSLQWQDQPSMSNWFLHVYDAIRSATDRPIVFRPHPRCRLPEIERGLKNVYRQDPVQLAGSYDDFDLTFNNVWVTVNWSSNPGPQSVIAGVPAIVGPASLAWDVADHHFRNIEQPTLFNRAQWLNRYAQTEYTVEEIAAGLPWLRLQHVIH